MASCRSRSKLLKAYVSVFLPVSPTAFIHVLPQVVRSRQVRQLAPAEINVAQAAFATKNCFTNVEKRGTQYRIACGIREGATWHYGVYNAHIDHNQVLFDIL